MNHKQAKKYVQEKYFGFSDENKCLLVFIGSINFQSGVKLIVNCFEEINKRYDNMQFIIGRKYVDKNFNDLIKEISLLKKKYPNNFWGDEKNYFTDDLVTIHAADFLIIPSIYEPSGIIQQQAFASGCPVIAFKTGGLSDTVFEFNDEMKAGNGLLFFCHKNEDFMMAIDRANILFNNPINYNILRENASNSVLSTKKTAIQWLNEITNEYSAFLS